MNTYKTKPALVIFALLAMNSVTVAWAKNETATAKEPVVVTLTQKRIVVDAKGNEKKEDAPKVKPGDLLEYSVVYHNRSKQAISGLKASLPIPAGLVYVKQSAKPALVQATTDGISYGNEPLLRTEKDKAGNEQQVEVPYVEYRSLRWEVGNLEASKQVSVSARVRVVELAKSPEELVAKPSATPLLKK
jgi:uncharacterized repeat protein (TIGR01451 family)